MDKAPNAPRGHLIGTGWPSYRYGPEGQAKIFQSEDEVPAGWADHPSKVVLSDEAPPILQEASVPLSRGEITSRLKLRGIEFSKNAPTKALYNKLLEATEAA